jgi:hypothetical protein
VWGKEIERRHDSGRESARERKKFGRDEVI